MPVNTKRGPARAEPDPASLVVLVALVATSRPAHAYIDPGTLSIVLQGTVASIAVLAIYFRTGIAKFLSIFRRRAKCEEPDPAGADGGGQAETDPRDQ